MGVPRRELRRAEKAHYALLTGKYLSGTEIGAGGVRAQIRLGYVAQPKPKRKSRAKAPKAGVLE